MKEINAKEMEVVTRTTVAKNAGITLPTRVAQVIKTELVVAVSYGFRHKLQKVALSKGAEQMQPNLESFR